jgi:hypothetical protein
MLMTCQLVVTDVSGKYDAFIFRVKGFRFVLGRKTQKQMGYWRHSPLRYLMQMSFHLHDMADLSIVKEPLIPANWKDWVCPTVD